MASEFTWLSFVAAFDDICRDYYVLRNDDAYEKFIACVQNQELCCQKWQKSEHEVERLSEIIGKVQSEKAALEAKLKHCRNALSNEMNLRKQVEEERESLTNQIELIKQLLMDGDAVNDQTRERFAFLSASINRCQKQESPSKRLHTIDESTGSILSLSDIDHTEDDIDENQVSRRRRRSKRSSRNSSTKKRPSAPPADEDDDDDDTPTKRMKEMIVEGDNSVVATTTVTVPTNGPVKAVSRIEALPRSRVETVPKSRMERSYSEPLNEVPASQAVPRLPFRSDSEDSLWKAVRTSGHAPATPTLTGSRRYSLRHLGSHRKHNFVTKTIMKPEKCNSCNKHIKFANQAYKCRECNVTVHVDCKDLAAPCTPPVHNQRPIGSCVIADYVPKERPLVPALVMHCIDEIEERGLDETGLYRVSGSEKERREIKDRFLRKKGIPNLSKYDIHAVCGSIKDFLRNLREPIVTYHLWREFANAAELLSDGKWEEEFKRLIKHLPQANRETLAYLIIHFQHVAQSPSCKMPVTNLASVLGPTIVGYSCPEPIAAAMYAETGQQATVMEKLLTIPEEYWRSFLDPSDSDDGGFNLQAPNTRSSLQRQSRVAYSGQTPVAPKDHPVKTTSFKRNFFASPSL